MPEFHTNAADALKILTSNYANLSRYGSKLMELGRSAPGVPLPCQIIDNYHRAVNEYLSFGRKIFQLLDKNKMQVEQVVYKEGKPQLDAKGNVRTLRISAPLRPPAFVVTNTFCPSATRVSGLYGINPRSEIGVGSLVALAAIPLAKLLTVTVGGIVVVGVTGYYGVEALRQVRLTFTNAPDFKPAEQVAAWEKCADHAKKIGMTPEQILKGCGPEGALKVPPGGSSNWGIILLGVAAVAGGVLIFSKGGGGGAT